MFAHGSILDRTGRARQCDCRTRFRLAPSCGRADRTHGESTINPILAYDTVTAEGATPARFAYFLHGIFGSGRNWQSVARRIVRERPRIGVRLIDLRQHGSSQNFEPPHTIAAAAADLFELARHLGEEPFAVLGHSFGGKVALMYAREHGETLEQLWLIDSTPDARTPDGSAWKMLQLVRAAPRQFESREALVSYLEQNGIPRPTGQWMATNLERGESGYRWRFDLNAIEQLLQDFFVVDLWSVIEDPPGRMKVHIVKAQESSVLSPAAIARVREAEARTGRVFYHEVAGGHWVNAENPGALQELLLQYFPD